MKVSEKTAPTAALLAALSTLACCVPMGFLGAVGIASVSLWAQQFRPWLLLASIAFLCVGAVQLYYRKSCGIKSIPTRVLFWTAVIVVVLVIVFPQAIASLIAG